MLPVLVGMTEVQVLFWFPLGETWILGDLSRRWALKKPAWRLSFGSKVMGRGAVYDFQGRGV